MLRPIWLWLTASLVFLAVLVLAEYVVRLQELHAREAMRAKQMASLTELRTAIESDLNATLYLGGGLVSFIRARPDASQGDIDALMADIYHNSHHLTHLVTSPNLVIRDIYPLTPSNANVLGLDYRKVPAQWPAVEAAIAARRTVIDGPVRLVQGGTAIISRTPVFLPGGKLWGMVGMVLDLDAVLADSGFHRLSSQFALRLVNPDKKDSLIAGVDKLPSAQFNLPVRVLGDTWQLQASPLEAPSSSLLSHAVALLVALLAAIMVYLILAEHRKVQFLAHHDTLTGLPNRRHFIGQLEQVLSQWRQRRRPFALFYLDLNGFKGINDQYGHQMGDAVLVEVAKRLRQAARGHDLVARIGGDEFVLLLSDLASTKDADDAARRFCLAVQKPMSLQGHTLVVKVAMGRARPGQGRDDADGLIRQADMAMYRQKTELTS
ncbi:MAG: diguanylate cyclase [Pseudomonadota bacterium]|uniref:diguanylate cyclase domain-containing protein n=1 Tax=Gallaecimonas pentaromativorans TaxID=584787 RepID=UPI000A85BDC0|nr:diguanylate cyclase [Gallaecimonas pentaromativorans]MED5524994.1 diguanylate cyclase [Pseudomonadota bacterium]